MTESKFDPFLPKGRLENLCDAIFAVTMTLMILELKAPENIPVSLETEELPGALWALFPAVESYVLSFIILGTFWIRHQIQLKFLKSIDAVVIVINVFFLLLTGFVPFTVELMKRYPSYDLTFILYDVNLLLIAVLLFYQWHYISNNDILRADELSPEVKRKILYFSFVPILIFVISMIISFINTRAALFVIYLVPIFYVAYNKYYNRKNHITHESKNNT